MKDLYGNDDIEAMYQAALAVPLAEKIEMAQLMIRNFEPMALNLSPDGYHVCFSGGKDSIVMAKLFEMAGVKHGLHYNNVTIDPPELVQFIKREYPQAVWSATKKNLPMRMAEKGVPPTRLMRWCCEEYKEQGGKDKFRAIGVRAAESARRKGLWQPIRHDQRFKNPIMSPILYWTDADIWQFIRGQRMPYCSLYDEGFKRLGCVGCPMADKQRVSQFKRWPKYEAMWRRGFAALHRNFKGVPKRDGQPRSIERFSGPDEHFRFWMEEETVNDTDNADCQMFLW